MSKNHFAEHYFCRTDLRGFHYFPYGGYYNSNMQIKKASTIKFSTKMKTENFKHFEKF